MSRNKNPKVSIIIVNFNNAKYLLKSLESALSQTYKNKEIIVIDDISDDNSLEILNKYKTKIKFYVNKTKTSFGSYNQINSYLKGVDKSTGRYICFLDSDDYFTKNKVNLVVRKFSEQTKIKTLFDIPIIKTNENLIIKEILENLSNKTIIIISHNSNTLKKCDRILKIEGSKISEQS